MKAKWLAVLLALVMVVSMLPLTALAADSALPFTDVKAGDWYAESLQKVYDLGLIKGVSDAEFGPNVTITRGMIVTILYRLEGQPAGTAGAKTFSDVAKGAYYADAVAWASANKIVNGYPDGTFLPDEPITREQLAAICYRYAQYKGEGFTGMWMFLLDFPDAADVADWANEGMHWMVMKGIINGMDGKLYPKGSATRAQAVTMLARLIDALAPEEVKAEFTVTFDENYSGGKKTEVKVTDGETVKAPADPTRSGYSFQGWFTEASAGVKFDFTTAITKDSTLFAHWASTGGGGGGGYTPAGPGNLVVSEAGDVYGVYKDVTIAYSVGNDTVTLNGVHIEGDLTIEGGGSHSVRLIQCIIDGKVVMAKESGEAPRLFLEETPVKTLEVRNNAIIETADDKSTVGTVVVHETAQEQIELKLEGSGTIPIKIDTAKPVIIVTKGDVTPELSSDQDTKPDVTINGQEACAHKWNEGKITTPATCEAKGVKTYSCAFCDETKTEEIPALGHAWGDWTKDDETNHKRVCANDATHVETEAHKWDEGKVTKEPTAEAEGEKTYTCTVCGATKTEAIAKHEHSWSAWTKEDDTNHKRTCAACNEVEREAHKWDAGVVTKAATETETGIKTYTCTVCGATKTEEIPIVKGAVEAPKGITAIFRSTVHSPTFVIEMIAPTDTANINYYEIFLYDSTDKDASMTHGGTCSTKGGTYYGSDRVGYFFHVNRSKFNPEWNIDKLMIVAHGMHGYSDATWTGDFSVTRTDVPFTASYSYTHYAEPNESGTYGLATVTLNTAVLADVNFQCKLYVNGSVLTIDDSEYVVYNTCKANEAIVRFPIQAAEADAALTGNGTVMGMEGWFVTQEEMVNGVPTVAFTLYSGNATKA